MDEHDFLNALVTSPSESRVLLRKLKTANAATDFARKNALPLAGALGGASLIGGMQYIANRPDKSGTSQQQRLSEALLKVMQEREARAKQEGRELSFADDLGLASAKGVKEVADTLTRHPKRGALPMAMVGGGSGWAFAKHIQNLARSAA